MPHWRSFTDREYIYSYDLGGQDRTLTIERVVGATLVGDKGKKSKKPVIFFKETKTDPDTGKKKGLALNATNGKSIAALYGNDTDAWAGKRITLYATTTEMGGETVECIRVRKSIPQASVTRGNGQKQAAEPEPQAPLEPAEEAPPEPGSDG
jgi:hypothetical protein